MAKKKEDGVAEAETAVAEEVKEPQESAEKAALAAALAELDACKKELAECKDKYLRMLAEYDNYRKRTAKEKEALWTDIKCDTAAAFLPVYDNLERAMNQATADEAYKKGVEMTMNQLKEVFTKLGITEIPAQGEPFDPKFHNAVMHMEDENLGENVICQVFQKGFKLGDKIIRFAMVQVAN